ncbi:uncharacterized protein [Amphiura filiformis]|uniref:uncharacterized protein isoform X2 n=1 Tax=Amphiura filiformis TaxID=82378 RepID=UPI003B21B5C6
MANITNILDNIKLFFKDSMPVGEDVLRQLVEKGILSGREESDVLGKQDRTSKRGELLEILKEKPLMYHKFVEFLKSDVKYEHVYSRFLSLDPSLEHPPPQSRPDPRKTMAVQDFEAKHGYGKVKLNDGINLLKVHDLKIQELLKEGGFGKVSLASHGHYGQVAIKEFRPEISKEDIYKEANKMWRVISCPYLVRIIGFVDEPARKMIVMTYFPHGNLRDFNRKYLMRCNCWPRRIRMLQEITLGMNYIHILDPPIIHSDLKLVNVFVEEGFKVKIGDFGLAISTTSKTADDIKGTISHIPPEALDGTITKPDKLWDVFTYGISLYEFASGQDAWKASIKSGIIIGQVLSGKRPNEAAIPKDVPQEILDIMKKCWDGNRDNRPYFHDIMKMVSDVFEKQYKQFIPAADGEINKLMTYVSGRRVNVTDESARLSKDSGITSDKSIAAPTSKSDVSVQKSACKPSEVFVPIDKPNAPSTPTVRNIGSKRIEIAWSPSTSDNGSPVTGYIVEKLDIKQQQWIKVQEMITDTKLLTSDVTAGNQYQFRVTASNKGGVSDSSQPSVTIIPYDKPSPPSTPTVKNIANKKIEITWSPTRDNGSPITGYIVEKLDIKQHQQQWIKVQERRITDTKLLTSDVTAGNQYQFRVAACNEGGVSDSSQPSVTIIPYGSPPHTTCPGTRPKVANVAEKAALEKQATGIAVTEAQRERKVHETKGEGLGIDGGASVISGGASVLARVAALNLTSTGTRDASHKILKTNTSISPTKPVQRKSDAAITGLIEEARGGNKNTAADSGTVGSDCAGASNESGIGSQHSKEWKLMQTFGQEGDKDGEFRKANSIAVCKNGDMVVTDYGTSINRAYMFNSNGTYKFTFQSHPTNPKGKLLFPSRVAVTPGGDVVISDQSNLVKIFSVSGDYLKSLSTVTAECNNSTKYQTWGVAISPSGVVYGGDIYRKVITVHDMDRQQPIKKLSVHIKPYHLSSDPDNNIWVSDWDTRQVIRYSDSGVELCRIKSFIVDNEAGLPRCAVYGKGLLYIVVMEVDEKNQYIWNTGHIHQYTRDGRFQMCIIKGMYAPEGIAMSNGKIYVANEKSVLVYEQQ